MTKLQALNALEVEDFSCCGEELEYVIVENNAANIKTLLDAGFTREQVGEAIGCDKTFIDLSYLAFEYAGAIWWNQIDGFTADGREG